MIRVYVPPDWERMFPWVVRLRRWDDFTAAEAWCTDPDREGAYVVIRYEYKAFMGFDHPLPDYRFTDSDIALEFRLRWG